MLNNHQRENLKTPNNTNFLKQKAHIKTIASKGLTYIIRNPNIIVKCTKYVVKNPIIIIRGIGYIIGRKLLKPYRNVRNLSFILRNRSRRRKNILMLRQTIFTYNTKLQLPQKPQEIKKIFIKEGIKYKEGRHSIYIYRIEDIKKINEQIALKYSKNIGLKIIYSTDISKDGTVYYTSNKIAPDSDILDVKAVGSILDKMAVSNILSLYNISPRVYDIIRIKSKKSMFQAIVVEHIKGKFVKGKKGEKFIKVLNNILNKEDIEILGYGLKSVDFRPPKFRSNLVQNENGQCYYVDIQNFEFKSKNKNILRLLPEIKEKTHFGDKKLLRGGKYSYQSIPFLSVIGKRDIESRINIIFSILEKNKYSIYNKTVLDVGCNLGMFIYYFLNKGARWCVGLDRPEIIEIGKKFLFYNNYSRFNLIGCDLIKPDVYKLLQENYFDIILYLSIEKHIDFPQWLNKIDFDYFVYEGHQYDNIESAVARIHEKFPGYTVIHKGKYSDGDCYYRPLVIIKKIIEKIEL